jgi:hypothetical protein
VIDGNSIKTMDCGIKDLYIRILKNKCKVEYIQVWPMMYEIELIQLRHMNIGGPNGSVCWMSAGSVFIAHYMNKEDLKK